MPKNPTKIIFDILTKIIFEILSEILNLKGNQNCCISSKVTAILLNGMILPTGGASSGRVVPAACAAGLFSRNPYILPFRLGFESMMPKKRTLMAALLVGIDLKNVLLLF